MSRGFPKRTPTDTTAASEATGQPEPMLIDELLVVLRAAVARLPREASPMIRDEAS